MLCEGTNNLELYQNILQENVGAAVHDLSLRDGGSWMQQDNDTKHTNKLNKESCF